MADSVETVIKVKVLPRSSRTEILGKENDVYRVKITDPPVEGKANKALVTLLSENSGCPAVTWSLCQGDGKTQESPNTRSDRADIAQALGA